METETGRYSAPDVGCFGAPFEFKFLDDSGSPAGSFEGYGAVFGNIDSHGDVIEPGAFAKSLLERERSGRRLPPMYKQHGMTSMGRDPVGVWEAMSEDAHGLHVRGRLIGLDTDHGKWTYAQAKEGGFGGLSIGYRVPPNGSKMGSGRPGEPRRYLKMLMIGEVSLVDDPSNVRATLGRVKSAFLGDADFADEIKTIRDFETFLRDVGGFSNEAAKAIASRGFKAQPEPRDEAGIVAEIRAQLSGLANAIRS